MALGTVTISIDLELAWGNWDNLEHRHVDHVERLERPIVSRLVEILDRHEFPVTWAFVAALLDASSAKSRPGGEHLWYAPDVIERIASAKVRHDLGSHGGRHKYLDSLPAEEAEDDLAFARSVHEQHGFAFDSFVFPRNKVGRKALLEKHGIRVYRGEDHAWHQRIRARFAPAGRIANLADKMLPVAPETVVPEQDGGLVNLPGSLLFLGREGIRRFVPGGAMRQKLRKGVAASAKNGRTFHLWFHPSNFWYDTEMQFTIFEEFIGEVAKLRNAGAVAVKPMAAFA